MGVLTEEAGLSLLACEEGCDPIEDRLRGSIRTTIEAVVEEELDTFSGRLKSSRSQGPVKGSPWWSPGAAHQHPGDQEGRYPVPDYWMGKASAGNGAPRPLAVINAAPGEPRI